MFLGPKLGKVLSKFEVQKFQKKNGGGGLFSIRFPLAICLPRKMMKNCGNDPI